MNEVQPNGPRISCGAHLERSQIEDYLRKEAPPASCASESAKRKRAHGVVGPRRGPGDPEGRWPPPPTDSRLDGERSSRASSCAHGTRASVRRRWPPRVTGESRDYATDEIGRAHV